MSRLVARNVLSTALNLDRSQAGWVADALTDAEITRLANPKSTEVPEADDIRGIAADCLSRIADGLRVRPKPSA